MPLFGRTNTTVGLDIGSGLVKVAVVDHSRGTPELIRVAVAPLLPDAIVEGEVMDHHLVAEAINEAMGSADAASVNVVTAVGGRDVIVKRLQTERVKEEQARELMRWEAEQHVPDIESVELDFHVLDHSGSPDEMSVMFVAAKRDLIEAKLRILSEAGLTPRVVDVDAFALHNAFELNHPEAMHGGVALLNIGNEVTTVNVLDAGVPVLTRDIAVGTRRFIEDLQRAHSMPLPEAEALVRGDQRSTELDTVLEGRLEELAGGIERAAAFLATTHGSETQLRAIYLCGGGSRVPGLAEALGSRLHIRLEYANPLAKLQVRDGAFADASASDLAPLLMLPVGLALRTAA